MNLVGSRDSDKAKQCSLSVLLIPVFFIMELSVPLLGSGIVFDSK